MDVLKIINMIIPFFSLGSDLLQNIWTSEKKSCKEDHREFFSGDLQAYHASVMPAIILPQTWVEYMQCKAVVDPNVAE